jgi:hypothetical protein
MRKTIAEFFQFLNRKQDDRDPGMYPGTPPTPFPALTPFMSQFCKGRSYALTNEGIVFLFVILLQLLFA